MASFCVCINLHIVARARAIHHPAAAQRPAVRPKPKLRERRQGCQVRRPTTARRPITTPTTIYATLQLIQPSLPVYKACAGSASRLQPRLPDWTRDTSKTTQYVLERATLLHLCLVPPDLSLKARIRKRSRYTPRAFKSLTRAPRERQALQNPDPANASFFSIFQITLTHLHRPCDEPCLAPARPARHPACHLPRRCPRPCACPAL